MKFRTRKSSANRTASDPIFRIMSYGHILLPVCILVFPWDFILKLFKIAREIHLNLEMSKKLLIENKECQKYICRNI